MKIKSEMMFCYVVCPIPWECPIFQIAELKQKYKILTQTNHYLKKWDCCENRSTNIQCYLQNMLYLLIIYWQSKTFQNF